MANRLVNWLLGHAPWYHPEAIEAREARTERVRRQSIAARLESEPLKAELDGAVAAFRRRR